MTVTIEHDIGAKSRRRWVYAGCVPEMVAGFVALFMPYFTTNKFGWLFIFMGFSSSIGGAATVGVFNLLRTHGFILEADDAVRFHYRTVYLFARSFAKCMQKLTTAMCLQGAAAVLSFVMIAGMLGGDVPLYGAGSTIVPIITTVIVLVSPLSVVRLMSVQLNMDRLGTESQSGSGSESESSSGSSSSSGGDPSTGPDPIPPPV